MDNIKFRAWQKYHKKMVEVTGIDFDRIGEIEAISTFVENQAPQDITYRNGLGRFFLSDERGPALEQLMQYTGLKDKNGVEIYEGDVLSIVELDDRGLSEYVTDVVWEDCSFSIKSKGADYYDMFLGAWSGDPNKSYPTFELEIIGNIYENPSLLEEST